jgi:hypothetical protein
MVKTPPARLHRVTRRSPYRSSSGTSRPTGKLHDQCSWASAFEIIQPCPALDNTVRPRVCLNVVSPPTTVGTPSSGKSTFRQMPRLAAGPATNPALVSIGYSADDVLVGRILIPRTSVTTSVSVAASAGVAAVPQGCAASRPAQFRRPLACPPQGWRPDEQPQASQSPLSAARPAMIRSPGAVNPGCRIENSSSLASWADM